MSLLFVVALCAVNLSKSTCYAENQTSHSLRLQKKREVSLDTLDLIPSTLLIGISAYNFIESIGSKVSDSSFQCISNARFQSTSSQSTVKMCTRSYTTEWHKNNLDIPRYKSGFQYKDDSLQINGNPMKWAWFEYYGSVCINFLAFSCGPSTVEGVHSRGTNFIVGSDVLEKWYTWNKDKNLYGIRRCGDGNKGVRLDDDVKVSFTVKREAFSCGDNDQACIAQNVFFDNGFINCYNS
ncbi:uncharacterized protein LOC124814996 isoform X2 [Hydra vulgaris]|uniref:Uncharacterized protein LOC124814996 isoform X2 n=1 Tax=Hydra vulgaris TaxID=6087 RepID=A0ABM4BYV6_HYDVU